MESLGVVQGLFEGRLSAGWHGGVMVSTVV